MLEIFVESFEKILESEKPTIYTLVNAFRSKINELNVENTRLNKEIETGNEENASFLTYEKRAETLASSIKDLQGELGDYNILVDKLTTDEDIADVELDLNDVSVKVHYENMPTGNIHVLIFAPSTMKILSGKI